MSAPVWALASALTCPAPLPAGGVEVRVVSTGTLTTRWDLVVDTGRKGPVDLPLLVGEIRHPDGMILVDAGMGQTTRDGVYPRFPASGSNVNIPAGASVAERYKDPLKILMTHLHYDHVGGLLDLDQTEVWTTLADWRTTATGNLAFPEAAMRRAVDWHPIDLRAGKAGQILGQPAIDVMGDGTIFYISTPGHTPGAASVLVRGTDETWLFVGDTVWVDAHIDGARRPFLVSLIVDGRPRILKKALQWVRDLSMRCPDLNVVAGHEPRWVESSD